MSIDQISQNSRLNFLDLFRFGALLIVILAHYTGTFNIVYNIVPENLPFDKIFKYGHIALYILFLISGYVVTMTSVNKNLKAFLVARLSRIYPLFWLSCLVGYLLPKILTFPTFLPDVKLKVFLTNLTMLPVAFGHEMINPVFWTMTVEIVFYFFVALIISFKFWKYVPLIISCIYLIIIIFYNRPFASALLIFTPFFSGMLIYLIQTEFGAKWKLYMLLAFSLLGSLRLAHLLAETVAPTYHGPDAYHVWVMWLMIIVILIAFLIIIINRCDFPKQRAYAILGDISYPLYLFHIYWMSLYWYFRDTIQPQLLLLGLIFIMIISCWVIHVFIEKPSNKLVKKILTKTIFSIETIGNLRTRNDSIKVGGEISKKS